jgi:hypothetical protein
VLRDSPPGWSANTKSYCKMSSDSPTIFPGKEQAVVCNATDGLTLQDYVRAIGSIVSPKNVLFASRISNERVCIYLSCKSLVDDVVSNHSSITINDKVVGVRRLINPARRIILSNVCPSIPHHVFENQIRALGFTVLSQMSFVRARILDDEYSHVLSFRRQIYVQPDDAIGLPDSVVLKFDNTNYRIFMTFDDICFKCKRIGHYASDCPQDRDADLETSTPNKNPTTHATTDTLAGKRQMTDDDETELSPSNPTNANSDSTGKSKKIRSSDSVESLTSTSELLMLAKDAVNNSEQYPIDFDQMVEFMEKVSGETDILALVRSFTNDTQGVINLLHDVYNVVPHKSIKNKCRKIQRRIRKALLSKDSVSADDLNLSTIVGEP